MPPPKDPKKYDEWRKKVGLATKGKSKSIEHKNKIRQAHLSKRVRQVKRERMLGTKNINYGKKRPDYIRKALSEAHKGKTLSTEHRQKLSEIRKGKPLSETHKENLRKHLIEINKARRGTHPSLETRLKLSESRKGNKSYLWKGGISFEPYCQKFNNEFKERVREFFGRRCVVCGINENENHKKLHVHHVNYDKMVCCNGNIPLFVPLCNRCHPKTSNGDRDYWNRHFEELIMKKYDGKCYYTKEEMILRHS